MPSFTVAIVGRPNVGKSTFFNRLLEERKAIVDDQSGVTRDRQYGVADWNGKSFNVIDTGGFVVGSDDVFEREIRKQVIIAMEEADLLVFVCDVTTGITDQDAEFGKLLRKGKKPVLLCVNKVDNSTRALDATEFYSLGFEHTFFVSSISGSGTGEILDALTGFIPADAVVADDVRYAIEHVDVEAEYEAYVAQMEGIDEEDSEEEDAEESEDESSDDEHGGEEIADEEDVEEHDVDEEEILPEAATGESSSNDQKEQPVPKIAIIGQPNAGKSTLLNALIGQERTIVSDIPGTTRDSIHTHYKMYGKEFVLIDTAGLRKKSNVHEDLEFYSVIRAIKAMDETDVCILMVDATKDFTAQDVNIFALAARKGKGIVLLVNKWDLVEGKETNTARDLEKKIRERIQPLSDVPILFVSASEKLRIFQAVEKALLVADNRRRRISTSKLNDIMLKEIQRFPPPMARGQSVKIKFCTQLPVVVPSFAFFANYPDSIKTPYRNFLENKIRQHFDFNGVPVRVFFRKK